MDACFTWLESASEQVDRLLDQYEESDYYAAVFEESDTETAKKSGIMDKATTIVQNMINSLRKIFNKIKEGLNNAMNWIKADGAEKTKYQKFVEECKNNPEFAGKKVTFKDYEEIIQAYDKTLTKAENDYRKLKDDDAAGRTTVGDKISADVAAAGEKIKEDIAKGMKFVAESGKELTASMTVQALLAKCKNSRDEAISIQNHIAKNEFALSILEKELGKKEVRKFKRKVAFLNMKANILTFIGKGRHRQELTLTESIKAAILGVDGVYRNSSKTNKDPEAGNLKIGANVVKNTMQVLNRGEHTKSAVKGVGKTGGKILGTGAKIAARSAKEYESSKVDWMLRAREAKREDKYDRKSRENEAKRNAKKND